MTEQIVFPDIERLLVDQLLAEGGGIDAGVAVPDDRTLDTAAFWVVRRVGGPRRNLVVDDAMVIVESWGPDRPTAAAAAQTARAIVNATAGLALDGHQIYRVAELAGPGFQPDPDSTHPRYTQTFTVSVRGAA